MYAAGYSELCNIQVPSCRKCVEVKRLCTKISYFYYNYLFTFGISHSKFHVMKIKGHRQELLWLYIFNHHSVFHHLIFHFFIFNFNTYTTESIVNRSNVNLRRVHCKIYFLVYSSELHMQPITTHIVRFGLNMLYVGNHQADWPSLFLR